MKTLIALSLSLFFFPSAAFAQSVGLDSIFSNGTSFFVAVIGLAKVASYILGISLAMGAVFALARSARDPSLNARQPIMTLIVAACLVALPAAIASISKSLALDSGNDAPGSILVSGTSNTAFSKFSSEGLKGVLTFIQMIGYIAFIRGFLLINRSALGQGQGLLGRGLVHVVGSILAIHVAPFAHVVANTFMPGLALPF